MKTAIVYYSLEGNTQYVADKITAILKESCEVEVLRLEPEKSYPNKGFKKFFWGGKSAVMAETPTLQPYEFDAAQYDRIIIGTPVWASTFTPPIRTFINENPAVKEKQIAVFTCFSGGGADKAIKKLQAFLEIENFIAELILVDPKDKVKEADDALIMEFCGKLK